MKTEYLSKTIAACDLKVALSIQLIIKLTYACEYSRSSSFLDLGPFNKIKMCFFQKPLDNFNQILYVNYKYDVGHMTKTTVKPIYGKNRFMVFFPWTSGPISTTR